LIDATTLGPSAAAAAAEVAVAMPRHEAKRIMRMGESD
jgi:hypothetical protein